MPAIGASEQTMSTPPPRWPSDDSQQWQRAFPGQERELAAVRRWLASLFPDCPARDDLTLVATELGTNAVRHTASGHGGAFAVTITCSGPIMRIAVADSGAPDGPQLLADADGENGRGLIVVQNLAVRTGVSGDRRGRIVWAELRWDGAITGNGSSAPHVEAAEDLSEPATQFPGTTAWFGLPTRRWRRG